MSPDNTDPITLGEVYRGQQTLGRRVDDMSKDLTEIKTTLAGQSVKVFTVWGGLGVAGAAFVTSLASLLIHR